MWEDVADSKTTDALAEAVDLLKALASPVRLASILELYEAPAASTSYRPRSRPPVGRSASHCCPST